MARPDFLEANFEAEIAFWPRVEAKQLQPRGYNAKLFGPKKAERHSLLIDASLWQCQRYAGQWPHRKLAAIMEWPAIPNRTLFGEQPVDGDLTRVMDSNDLLGTI
eukprot:scaffold655793_cov57-Prasinocladus_malaysianus.AAC.1